MIHVEKATLLKTRSGLTFCGLATSDVEVSISSEELRRRIHTFGRKATEQGTCMTCYDLARPKKPQGPRLPKGPGRIMPRRSI